MKKLKLFAFLFAVIFAVSAVNSYAQWSFAGFVTGAGTFPSISAYGPNSVVVGGGPNGTGKVFKSTNGGTNWTDVSGTGLLLELYCVWAADDNNMFAGDGGASGGAGGNARVYRTTNGGTLWTTAVSTGGSAGFINGVVFSKTTPSFGIAQSDPPTGTGQVYWVAKSTDAGATWTVTNPPGITGAASSQNSIVVIDNQFYGFGLNAGASRVYTTANGGTSWTIGNLGVAGSFISGYSFNSDKTNGCACSNTSLPNIARTSNGGTSFSVFNIGSGVTGYCVIKWIHGTNVIYIGGATGTGGVIKRSSDGGSTWATMTTGGITGLTHLEYYKQGTNIAHLYAVAADGSVIRYRDSSITTGINPNNNTTPTEYRLEQNFPNPFNPSTTINYSLPYASDVSLKIYDMLGHEIMSVVNGYQGVGNYTETIDASGLSSGIYFYVLKAGNFTESKKMTLIK